MIYFINWYDLSKKDTCFYLIKKNIIYIQCLIFNVFNSCCFCFVEKLC
ncbi:hypothetical protein PROPEN_03115 [Proteus penneri ATCC 35198]|nr:hypothetical protein PROPEN_03115 [Proteus penneri ATCC 35198]